MLVMARSQLRVYVKGLHQYYRPHVPITTAKSFKMSEKPPKYDANTEAFQMRAQWKKSDNCRKLWFERWSWLLDERKEELEQSRAVKKDAADDLHTVKTEITKSLKPVPLTSTGVIGWLSSRPDCQLEIYRSWLHQPPLHLPDAWENANYTEKPE